jgi:hypothetical protein
MTAWIGRRLRETLAPSENLATVGAKALKAPARAMTMTAREL